MFGKFLYRYFDCYRFIFIMLKKPYFLQKWLAFELQTTI